MTRVAARRIFRTADKRSKRVVLTLGVPVRVPGSDWGCSIRIQGLGRLRVPRIVYGIDGLQALRLAIQVATTILETCGTRLKWLGEPGQLGLSRDIPEYLPKVHQEIIERVIERESKAFYLAAGRDARGRLRDKGSKPRNRRRSSRGAV